MDHPPESQVAMDWEPVESRAQAVRILSIRAIMRQLGSHPPTVSTQLGPRTRYTATVTDNEVRSDLAQTLFPWEVLPFPAVSVVTVPRPKGGAADVAAQVREWMTPRGFLELTRGVLSACQMRRRFGRRSGPQCCRSRQHVANAERQPDPASSSASMGPRLLGDSRCTVACSLARCVTSSCWVVPDRSEPRPWR